jgi:tetrapyrrole methylase family protein/MazG family protein
MSEQTETKARVRFSDLVAIMARLRDPRGCPWDREQDHRSLRRCLLEEAYEVLEAIDRGDAEALRQELGDLLLQVIFHARLAEEAGEFDIEDVIQGLHQKLVERHPHVFGDKAIATAEGVVEEWESLKRERRQQSRVEQMAQAPKALPALARAQMVLRRAARAGVQRSPEEAGEAIRQAAEQVGQGQAGSEEKLGELLLAAVDLARAAGVDAEQALRERVNRFVEELRAGV